MTVNQKGARTIGARFPEDRRKLLESIQHRKGHQTISDTVVEALNEYIDRHLIVKEAA